jgi:hypothetical protein
MYAFGVKRTSSFFYRRFRCANAARLGGGSPNQICASVRVSVAASLSRSSNAQEKTKKVRKAISRPSATFSFVFLSSG